MKKALAYFNHMIKTHLRPCLYSTVISFAFTFIVGLQEQVRERHYSDGSTEITYYSTLYLPVIVLCILCYLVPIIVFPVFKRRRNLDCFYALPLSRRALASVHYLVGLLLVLFPFTICYLANFILLLVRGHEHYYLAPMIGHFFLCILMGFIVYSFFTFVYNEANSRGDGVVFMALWTFAFALFFSALRELVWDKLSNMYLGIPWMVIDSITVVYQKVVQKSGATLSSLWEGSFVTFFFIFWIALGILSAVGFFLLFGKRRGEKTEEISDSFFGYKTLIPFLAVCCMLSFDVTLVSAILYLILAFVGYTIYRRGFRYHKSDLIVIASLATILVAGFIF